MHHEPGSKCGAESPLIPEPTNELMLRRKIMDRYDVRGKKE